MVLDELARRRSAGRESCDRDGRLAAAGQVDQGAPGRAAGRAGPERPAAPLARERAVWRRLRGRAAVPVAGGECRSLA